MNNGIKCDVCAKDDYAGTACSGLGPVSWSYCHECASNYSEPLCMFEYTYDECGDNVAGHVRKCKTFVDGKYITWAEYVEIRRAI